MTDDAPAEPGVFTPLHFAREELFLRTYQEVGIGNNLYLAAGEHAGWSSAWTIARWLIAGALVTGLAIGWTVGAYAETIDGDRITLIDGDTVALPCDPARGIYPGCSEHIRLVGIDAPETFRARCEAEREIGLEAKAKLAELLRGHTVEITRTGRDRYGRTLARLTTEAGDIEPAMLATGLAVPYAPGRRAWADRCRHWCPGAEICER